MSEIKKAVKKMMDPGGFNATVDRGIVLSVDKNELTCVVQLVSNDAELQDVKLKPIISEGDLTQLGLILFPAVNSFVVVAQIDRDNTDVMVVGFTIIESISLDTNTALKLLITNTGNLNLNAVQMVFNNGKNGGIPLLNPLAAAIAKLQTQVNNLTTVVQTHTHPVVGANTGLTTMPTPAPISPILKPSDIENKSITQ